MSSEPSSSGLAQASWTSDLIGAHDQRWSLARAIDALGAAARQAGQPGLIWAAGLFYPTISLGLNLGWDGLLTQSLALDKLEKLLPRSSVLNDGTHRIESGLLGIVAWQVFIIPFLGFALMPFLRLVAGLVRISPPSAWTASRAGARAPRLRSVWEAGQGLTLSVFGVWAMLNSIIYFAIGVLILPVASVAIAFSHTTYQWSDYLVAGALVGPMLLVLVPYILALFVLQQLALHSLAHNRRGIASALIHAWRIMRNDVWATARAVLVDILLFVSIWLIWSLLKQPLELFGERNFMVVVVKYVLIGFAGVARAGYWARAYHALGGLSPDDGVPGLSDAPADLIP